MSTRSSSEWRAGRAGCLRGRARAGRALDVVVPVRCAEDEPEDRARTAAARELERRYRGGVSRSRSRAGRPWWWTTSPTPAARSAPRTGRYGPGRGRVLVAVPICPARSAAQLRLGAVELVCVAEPRSFGAVGHWYWYANACPAGEGGRRTARAGRGRTPPSRRAPRPALIPRPARVRLVSARAVDVPFGPVR
ncbi:hypothetical protein NKH77_50845 [Streptomyces sp. M19]